MSSSMEQHTRHSPHYGPSDALSAWQPLLPSVDLAHTAAAIVTETIRFLNERFITAADHRRGTEGRYFAHKGFEARRGYVKLLFQPQDDLAAKCNMPRHRPREEGEIQKAEAHASYLGKGPEPSLKPREAARHISRSGR